MTYLYYIVYETCIFNSLRIPWAAVPGPQTWLKIKFSFKYYLPTAITELQVSNIDYWPRSTSAYRKDFEVVKFSVLTKESLRLLITKFQLRD